MTAGKDRHPEAPDILSETEEILNYFNRGKRFLEELLRENERLRYKILHLEQDLEVAESSKTAVELEGDSRRLRDHLASITSRFDSLKKENVDFHQRSLEVEKQNENLLNLYVSGYQLHSTFQEERVLEVIKEILLNLVGAEVFALWTADPRTGRPELKIMNDEDAFFAGAQPVISDELWDELEAGRSRLAGQSQITGTPEEPLACVPFLLEGQVFGFLAIYTLLVQKEGLTTLDHDLLGLLASQAAAALVGSMLFSGRSAELRGLQRPGASSSPRA
jgi:hypothetical protein